MADRHAPRSGSGSGVGVGDAAGPRRRRSTARVCAFWRATPPYGLASALVHAPDIAILDEPTAGLDPAQRWKFRELLRELASSIPSWIVSTHDVEDLSENYDHCVVLGRDPWSGTPAELAGLVAAGPRRYERACAELM